MNSLEIALRHENHHLKQMLKWYQDKDPNKGSFKLDTGEYINPNEPSEFDVTIDIT